MSSHKKRGRWRDSHLRAILVAGLALAALGLAGPGAGSAVALGEQCSGGGISGHGSYLQSRAQSVWSGGKEGKGFNASGDSLACSGSQGSKGVPSVSFNALGSGEALHGWGADDGVFHEEGFAFLASDEAPDGPVGEAGTQLQRMKEALGSDLVVAPVTQTAIAIAANPPALPAHSACVVGQITGGDLEHVFAGTLTNWRQLTTASDQEAGGDCDQAITRVVRGDTSGTTYQFKHYLDQLEPEPLDCTGEGSKTWAQLQSSSEPTQANLIWPRKSDCQEGEGPVTVVTAPGKGSAETLAYVNFHPGTITYADLPSAEQSAPERILKVGNGVTLVGPAGGENEANCTAASYTLPAGWESGLNVDWSQVYGSNPEIGKETEGAYPICTLSWAVAAADSGGVFGNKVGTTTRDYLRYVNSAEGGRSDVHGNWYASLSSEVAGAATAAIAEIGGEGEEEEGEGGHAVLCKVAPEEVEGKLSCPSGKGYSGELTGSLVKLTQFKATAPTGTINCGKAELTGSFNEDGSSAAGVTFFSFSGTEGLCTSALSKLTKSGLKMIFAPFDASKFTYLGAIAPQGAFVIAKAKGVAPILALSGEISCEYKPAFLGGQVVNGAPMLLILTATWERFEGPEGCPAKLTQSSELHLNREGEETVYVASE